MIHTTVRPLFYGLAATLFILMPIRGLSQPSQPSADLNSEGYTGLLSIPSADVMSDGAMGIGFSTRLNPAFHPQADRQRNYYFAFGFLPRLELGARLFTVDDPAGRPLSVGDITPNIKIKLLHEGRYQPDLVIGSQDMYGTGFLTSDYIVSAKSWRRLQATAGYGRGRGGSQRLDGLFYGAKATLHPNALLLAEYDTQSVIVGLRVSPLRRIKADVMVQSRNRFAFGISYQFDLHRWTGSLADVFYRPSLKSVAASTPPVESPDTVKTIEGALIEQGFENVYVQRIGDRRIQVEYEDRRDNSNELRALGRVLAIATQYAAEEVDTLTVVVKELNLPVLELTVPKPIWRSYSEGHITAQAFREQVLLSNRTLGPVHRGQHTSRFKFDLILRPGIQAIFGSEIALAAVRFTLRPDVVVQFGRGTVLQVGAEIPVGHTSIIFNTGVVNRRTGLRRAMLHQSVRWPHNIFTQTSAGVVGVKNYGVVHETLVLWGDGRSFLKSTVGVIRDTPLQLNRHLALLNYRYRIPVLSMTASVTVGQFLDNDRGISAHIYRYFGNNQMNLFMRKTNQASGFLVGIGVAIPLMPVRDTLPRRFRLRLDNHYQYAQGIRATGGSNGFLRSDIGNQLRTDHEIETILFNRDRLYPVYIREHLDQIIQHTK